MRLPRQLKHGLGRLVGHCYLCRRKAQRKGQRNYPALTVKEICVCVCGHVHIHTTVCINAPGCLCEVCVRVCALTVLGVFALLRSAQCLAELTAHPGLCFFYFPLASLPWDTAEKSFLHRFLCQFAAIFFPSVNCLSPLNIRFTYSLDSCSSVLS